MFSTEALADIVKKMVKQITVGFILLLKLQDSTDLSLTKVSQGVL